MSSTISALTSGGGLAMAGDTSGQLELKTNNGTTAFTLSTSQNATFASKIAASTSLAGYVGTFTNTNGATDSNGVLIQAGTSSSEYAFRVDNTSSSATRMTVKGNGATIFGKTSEAGMATGSSVNMGICLNDSGNSGIFSIQENTDANMYFSKASGYSSGIYVRFYVTGTQVGKIETNGSSTSYVTSSDYRLKEDIAPMTGALAKVALLKPVTYKWKSNGSASEGFIAHELQEVCPDAVSGEKDALNKDGDIEPQGIDTSFLVATLTAAIQELNAKVDAQALEIQALKGVA